MDALILCGGYATRLEPITLFVPKPLLPIGGRPLLDYIIEDIDKLGVNRIVISTNKKFADQFEYWVENKNKGREMSRIELIVEPTLNHGTKFGAVKGIHYSIEKAGIDDDLLIVAGDNFYNFSLSRIISHFKLNRKPTICVHDVEALERAKRFGVVKLDGHRVLYFHEKPEKPESTLISTGIYIFPKEMFAKFSDYLNQNNNPDAPGYFLQWLIKNAEVDAVVHKGTWFDIGTIETYKEVFAMFHREKI
jgi:glucose-1-phosphate thymidylyltransferase